MRILNQDEMENLLDNVNNLFLEANRMGTLDIFMEQMGLSYLLSSQEDEVSRLFTRSKKGIIVVLGALQVSKEKMLATTKFQGISKERIRFCNGYEEFVNYRSFQYQSEYSAILVGPMPHKTSATGEYSSAISAMCNEPGYPHVERLTDSHGLKITKQSFKKGIQTLLDKGIIEPDL